MIYEVFALEDEARLGFYAFKLIENGEETLFDHDPAMPGTLMTEEVAKARAEEKIYAYEHPVPPPVTSNVQVQYVVQQSNPNTLGPIEFLNRFTSEEYAKLLVLQEKVRTQFEKAVEEDALTNDLIALHGFFTMWDKAEVIDPTYPPLIIGLTLVCNSIGMSTERIHALLTL